MNKQTIISIIVLILLILLVFFVGFYVVVDAINSENVSMLCALN